MSTINASEKREMEHPKLKVTKKTQSKELLTISDDVIESSSCGWPADGILGLFRRLWKAATVEPLLACYILPSVLASLAVQNLNLEKACRVNEGYGDVVCDRLINQDVENLTLQLLTVQERVADMAAWRAPLQTALPALMITFVGAWSDRTRLRRPCMLVPLIGELLSSLGLILCTYFFLQWPLEIAGLIEAVPPAITGGWTMMFMATFSYIADHTTVKERTFRIGIVNVFVSIGIPIGTALSGVLTKHLGFYGIFIISSCLYISGFVYGVVKIKDVERVEQVPEMRDGESQDGASGLCYFFSLRHVTETLMVAFKPRIGSRRMRVMLLMMVFIVITGPIYGEVSVAYLYARYRYNFTEVDYSIFLTYSVILNLIGTVLAMTVLSRWLLVDDCLVGALGCLSKILAGLVYALAPSRAWLYAAPALDLFSGTAVIAMRSIATKLVEPSETGRIQALFGVVEAVVPMIYSPLYSRVYVSTLTTVPGAFFLVGALLTVPALLIFMSMNMLQKKDEIQEENLKIANSQKKIFCYDNEVTPM